MTWLRIAFQGALTHVVPDRLLASLVADMTTRGHGIENFETKYGAEGAAALGGNPKVVASWAFDLGGPCRIDEPRETVEIDGLAIDVPCVQFGHIVRAVRTSRERRFASGDAYHKLKFWCHATVLTVEQRDHVLHTLEGLHQNADQRAFAFVEAVRRERMERVS